MLIPTSAARPVSQADSEKGRVQRAEFAKLVVYWLESGSERATSHPLHTGLECSQWLQSEGQTAPFPATADEAPIQKLIGLWADAAVSHAIVRPINDPAGFVATVAGIDGAWGYGAFSGEALSDLRSVLIDWASLKLEHEHDDIPSMEGLHLVVER